MTKAMRCSAATCTLAIFGLGFFTLGSMPARAADPYGCRGDQACVKIAETTQCDAVCQRACRDVRFDAAGCYATWGPKFVFMREQQQRNAQKRGTK